MAGIGFSLRKLFGRKGMFSLAKAYGYAGLICAGPMLLGVCLLLGVSVLASKGGLSDHDKELLNCMITYSLLASLTVTSVLNMLVTRFVSDMLYEGKTKRIMPSFYGSISVMLVGGGILYGLFLLFSGVEPIYKVLCFLFFAILVVVWTQMNYLTALKEYKGILAGFAVSLAIAFLLALALVWLEKASIVTLFLCVIIGYGILMTWYFKLLLDFFPEEEGITLNFLRWADRYKSLIGAGFFFHVGLFAHLVIMYFGPLRVQVEGLFYGAPQYDVPALAAYFSLLITTVNFVTSVEVNFYPKYRNYYGLFNDKGSILDIEQAEKEMLSVARKELTFGAYKQLIATILFVVFGSGILQALPLGFNDTSIGIYRLLCVGYGLYAVANTLMLILLYFADNKGALMASGVFATVSVAATIVSILFWDIPFFGIGFGIGSVCFYLASWIRLEWYTKKLPYFLLSKQAVLPDERRKVFGRLCDWLEKRAASREQKKDTK